MLVNEGLQIIIPDFDTVRESMSPLRWVLNGRRIRRQNKKNFTTLSLTFNASLKDLIPATHPKQSAQTSKTLTLSSRKSGTKAASACIFSTSPQNQKGDDAPPSKTMFQKLIQLASLPYQKLTSKTPSPNPTPTPSQKPPPAPSSPITMTIIRPEEPKRVSPRGNKGIFISTKLDREQAPRPQMASKRKSGKKVPSTKNTPKAIKKAKKPAKAKAKAPKKAAPSPPSSRSRGDRASDRTAPARAAADRKAQ